MSASLKGGPKPGAAPSATGPKPPGTVTARPTPAAEIAALQAALAEQTKLADPGLFAAHTKALSELASTKLALKGVRNEVVLAGARAVAAEARAESSTGDA